MGKVKNHVKQGFQTFCNQTSMHGFVELYNAKNVGWAIFWAVLLAAAIGLTTYQVKRAINQFMDQSSNTRAEPADRNDMYPPIKFCSMHWMYWVDWEKALIMKFTKESILYGMSYLTNIYTTNRFDVQTAKNQFLVNMAMNNFTKIHQFYEGIAKNFPLLKSSTPFSNSFDKRQMFISNLWGPLMCYNTQGDVIMRAIMNKSELESPTVSFFIKVQGYTTINNVTLNEYNYYVSQYLSDTGFYIDKNDGKPKDFSTYSSPFLLYVDGYSQDYLPIRDEDDLHTMVISINANRWRSDSNFQCLLNQKYIQSNSSICQNCKTLYPDIVCRCKSLAQAISSNSDEPGSLCQNKFFLIFNENSSSVNFASENVLTTNNEGTSCWTNDTAKKLQDSCPKCLYPCEVWSYSFSYVIEKFGTTTARNYFTKSGTGIRVVYPNDYDIYIMVEVERQTWEDFVANIGGLLGVWTGASLLSIIQLFYLCCFSQLGWNCAIPIRKKNEVIAFERNTTL